MFNLKTSFLIKDMFSPLEQFDVVRVFNIYILNWINCTNFDFSLTNVLIPLIYINICILILYIILKLNLKLIPESWQLFFEFLYNFVLDILKQQVGPKGLIYFPFYFTIFNFVLLSNLLSLIPFGIALTSHLILILYFSITICLSIFLIGLIVHNLKFLRIFIPECPFLLLPILILIEIFSYIIRMFSLAIRLAANILAGHTLVYIISSFILNVSKLNIFFFFFLVIPLLAVLLLELGVAFLQAFVFTILLSIYLSDSLKGPVH